MLGSASEAMGILPAITSRANAVAVASRPDSESHSAKTYNFDKAAPIFFHQLLLDRLLPGYRCLETTEIGDDGAARYLQLDEAAGIRSIAMPPKSHVVTALQSLPNRTEITSIWAFYFSHTHLVYPFLPRPWLEVSYDRLLRHGSSSDLLSLGPEVTLHLLLIELVNKLSGSVGRTVAGKCICSFRHGHS